MSFTSEKLKRLAEANFCKECYRKFLDLIFGEIEYLLSEPISDWRATEQNISLFWIKAKGFYEMKSGVFSSCPDAFKKAENETTYNKLKFLKDKGIIKEYTYEFLNQVRKRRNNVHPPKKFSKDDYFLFREARGITDAMFVPIIHDSCSDVWKSQLPAIEKSVKNFLEKRGS